MQPDNSLSRYLGEAAQGLDFCSGLGEVDACVEVLNLELRQDFPHLASLSMAPEAVPQNLGIINFLIQAHKRVVSKFEDHEQ